MEAAVCDETVGGVEQPGVPPNNLPDVLATGDGRPVRSAADWHARRTELLATFAEHVYGHPLPALSTPPRITQRVLAANGVGGKAVVKEVTVTFGASEDAPRMHVLLFLPRRASGPVPAFLGLNFYGNASVSDEPSVPLYDEWVSPDRSLGIGERATERTRNSRPWPIETILDRGYAVATACYGDLAPDTHDAFPTGLLRAFAPEQRPRDIGAIGIWSSGLSRILDILQQQPPIDAGRVAVLGHSRLGKAALWAGACDQRFAMVIPVNSGAAGAALFRHPVGEDAAALNERFPYWFSAAFDRYSGNEAALPVDQHQLLALIAPRPLYVAAASEDLWADPAGSFLAAVEASRVYRLLGREGLPATVLPPVDVPVHGTVGYHVRSGGHALKTWDWMRFLDFADRHLGAAHGVGPRLPSLLSAASRRLTREGRPKRGPTAPG